MTARLRVPALIGLLLFSLAGCATRFSPGVIRDELTAQHGQEPTGVFEVDLGRFTTMLIKKTLSRGDGELPLSGLDQFQLAVYEAPSDDGPAFDVGRIKVRGWETVLRTHDESRSGLVLIRPDGEMIGDLVVIGSGRKTVVYARLRGSLDPELAAGLGQALNEGGTDSLRESLKQLTEETD